MKILTYNQLLESNFSYAQTFRRVIDNTPEVEWFYGSYGYNGGIVKMKKYTAVPCTLGQMNAPKEIDQVMKAIQPDILFMHDDLQRCQWIPYTRGVPTVVWTPWDNEDQNRMPSLELAKRFDINICVAKFAQQIFKKNGIDAMQIYNPVDTKIYHRDDKAREMFRTNILHLPKDAKLITWIGRPGWRKRFMHVVEIAARLMKRDPNVYAYIHTDPKDQSFGYNMDELLYSYDLLNNPRFLVPEDMDFKKGYPPEMMNAIYNATDLYIAPHGGEGHCCIAGTRVLTENGYKNIEDIDKTDLVLNYSGNFVKVTDTFKRDYDGELCIIERYYDTPITCTPEHLIYTNNGWKMAKDITPNDWMVKLYEPTPKMKDFDIPLEGTNVWWLLGLYLAEGCCSKKGIALYIHKDEVDEVLLRLEHMNIRKSIVNQTGFIKDYVGKIKCRGYKKGNRGRVDISSVYLSEFLSQFGKKAYEKHIPDEIFVYLMNDTYARKQFLSGLYYGDGHFQTERDGRVAQYYDIEITSKILLEQYQRLLEVDGTYARLVQSRPERQCMIKGIVYDCHACYRLKWSSNQEYIKSDSNRDFIKVKRVSTVSAKLPVYNIEVEANTFDNHSYQTSQGLIHNCLPITEALSCGKPFVATDYTTTAEFAGYVKRDGLMVGTRGIGAKIGYMFKDKGIDRPYADLKDFTDKCELLLKGKELYERMSANGPAFVKSEMDSELVGQKLQNVFKDVSQVNMIRCNI